MLNPPFLPKYSRFSRSPAVTKSGTIYYPIWHAYAAGLLEKEGHNVKLIDAPADGLSREDCYKIPKDFMPDMVVVYTSTPSISLAFFVSPFNVCFLISTFCALDLPSHPSYHAMYFHTPYLIKKPPDMRHPVQLCL